MKVTIIIPSYGQKQYLAEAIDSALEQSHGDIEVIVIDDGSFDGSLEVAEQYGGEIKLIKQKNKSLASARNTGIMNATGDYILPLDADDVLLPHAVKKLLAIAEETNADSVAPSIHCFGYGDQDVILIPNPTLDDFKEGNRLAYCQLFKKSTLLEVGGYSPRMDKGWEDLHLTYDLLTRGKKIVTTQEVLLYYRTKEESMWKTAEKNKEALWAQLIKDFPEIKDHAKS